MRSPMAMLKALSPTVPAGHHQFALVVGVDQADQVAENDAVLMAQARARQDHRRQARIADIDRQTGGNQHGLARFQHQFFLQHGAQVETGGARGGVLREGELVAEARIEDLGL